MSFEIQQQIRQNANDIRNYIDDLYKWEDNVNDSKKTNNKKTQNNYPIRGSDSNNEEKKSDNSNKNVNENLKRDKNNVINYYNAWDNFDVDEELEKVGCSNNIHEFYQNTGTNKSKNSKIEVKGGRAKVDIYLKNKELADNHFKEKKFEKSIEIYNETMNLIIKDKKFDEKKSIYLKCLSNKCQCLINLKKYDECILNLNKAISIDNQIAKNYYRRSICFEKLKNFKNSLKDLYTAKNINPEENEINIKIKNTENFIKKSKNLFIKNMIISEPKSNKERKKIICIDINQQVIANPNQEIDNNITKEDVKIINTNPKKEEKKEIKPTPQDCKYEDYFKSKDNSKVAKSEFISLKDIEGKLLHSNKIEKIINTVEHNKKRTISFINYQDHKINFNKNKPILKKNGRFSLNKGLFLNKEEKLKFTINKVINEELLKYKEIKTSQKFYSLWNFVKKEKDKKLEFISNLSYKNILSIFNKGIDFQVLYDILDVFNDLDDEYLIKNPNIINIFKSIFEIKGVKLILKMFTKKEMAKIIKINEKLKDLKIIEDKEFEAILSHF